MNKCQCESCGVAFKTKNDLKKHQNECPKLIFQKGPSFKASLTKKEAKIRRRTKGSYEWASVQPTSNIPKRLKKLLLQKPKLTLEKEIRRLEKRVAFNPQPEPTELKRLIAFSHAYRQVFGHASTTPEPGSKDDIRQKREKELAHKKAVREMHEKLKPDTERTCDIMDMYFKSGERVVTSGGLPSLGKRR